MIPILFSVGYVCMLPNRESTFNSSCIPIVNSAHLYHRECSEVQDCSIDIDVLSMSEVLVARQLVTLI